MHLVYEDTKEEILAVSEKPTIRLQRSGWTVVLKAKGLLTGSLKKNTRFHRVSTEEHYMRILERK